VSRFQGKQILVGDGLVEPDALTVEFGVQEGSIEATAALAQTIIDECKVASVVSTPRGGRGVDGVLSHSLVSEGVMVRLRVEFAPTGGVYT